MRAGKLVINKCLLALNPLVINFQIECFNTLYLQEGRREIINWIDNDYGMLGTTYILTDLVCIRTLSIIINANECLLLYTARLGADSDKTVVNETG